MKKVLAASVVILMMAGVSQASVVTLTINAAGGTWEAYGQLSSDCKGLASFIINVTGSGGLTVTGSLNESPVDSMVLLFGFSQFRGDGTAGVGIMAGQNTVYGATYSTAADGRVLRDVGILPGSRLDPMTMGMVTWAAPVLLASGTYSGTVGTLTVTRGDGNINALKKDIFGTDWRGPGNVLEVASPLNPGGAIPGSVYIPEPATLVLVMAGVAGLVVRRRR